MQEPTGSLPQERKIKTEEKEKRRHIERMVEICLGAGKEFQKKYREELIALQKELAEKEVGQDRATQGYRESGSYAGANRTVESIRAEIEIVETLIAENDVALSLNTAIIAESVRDFDPETMRTIQEELKRIQNEGVKQFAGDRSANIWNVYQKTSAETMLVVNRLVELGAEVTSLSKNRRTMHDISDVGIAPEYLLYLSGSTDTLQGRAPEVKVDSAYSFKRPYSTNDQRSVATRSAAGEGKFINMSLAAHAVIDQLHENANRRVSVHKDRERLPELYSRITKILGISEEGATGNEEKWHVVRPAGDALPTFVEPSQNESAASAVLTDYAERFNDVAEADKPGFFGEPLTYQGALDQLGNETALNQMYADAERASQQTVAEATQAKGQVETALAAEQARVAELNGRVAQLQADLVAERASNASTVEGLSANVQEAQSALVAEQQARAAERERIVSEIQGALKRGMTGEYGDANALRAIIESLK